MYVSPAAVFRHARGSFRAQRLVRTQMLQLPRAVVGSGSVAANTYYGDAVAVSGATLVCRSPPFSLYFIPWPFLISRLLISLLHFSPFPFPPPSSL